MAKYRYLTGPKAGSIEHLPPNSPEIQALISLGLIEHVPNTLPVAKVSWSVGVSPTSQRVLLRAECNQPICSRIVYDGKPVYISPSLSNGGQGIIFGNLDQFYVRASKMVVRRSVQAAGYIENGVALYTGLMRADSVVFDPTGGSTPPVIFAGLHS